MNLKDFDKLLFPNGKPKATYSNMVGIDHLIKTCNSYSKDIKYASSVAAKDTSFDAKILPYNEIIEYQICYFIINLMRIKEYNKHLEFIYNKSNIASSWMTTDLCNQYLKKADFKEYKPYFLKFIKSKGTYQKRFGYVLALKFARDEETSIFFLNHIIKDDAYYVMMAEAWLIAEIGIYHFDLVCDFLRNSNHSLILKKKAISKMIDSYRISDDNKTILKEIRNML